jgi:predicted dehydrogenase
MKMWLVGAGYWGSKIQAALDRAGVKSEIIDIRNGQTIQDITTQDPVMLATPLWQHYDQCRELIDRGLDLYVEKPMAENRLEVLDLKNRTRPGQIVMVGHIFQHHPQRNEIKTLINTGFIGTLQHITSHRLNWGIYQTRTDPVLSLATHDISIIDDFCRAPILVRSVQRYQLSANLQPDRVVIDGTADSVSWQIDVSWCWPVRTRQTVFIGTEGQIVWNQDNNTYTITRHRIENNRAVTDGDPETAVYKSDLSPLDHEVAHWVHCVQQRQSPTTGFAQALVVADVIDQIHRLL